MARVRKKPGTREKLLALIPPLVLEPEKLKGSWREFFKNNNPIHVELGIGKGRFIKMLAEKNPHINYLGIEVVEEVLLKAIEKNIAEGLLPNLAYVWLNANELKEIFANNEVERIYLNFSDPWPKNKYAKRRMTHNNFLKIYKDILNEKGLVQLKTDNMELFEFSLNEFSNERWRLQNVSLDLYRNLPDDNVATEYEMKFAAQGMKIYKLEAKKAPSFNEAKGSQISI